MCTIKDKVFVLGGESEQNAMNDADQVFSLELCELSWPIETPPALTHFLFL